MARVTAYSAGQDRWSALQNFNADGLVNFSDYCILADEWFKIGEPLTADLIEDNKINERDLAEFCYQWLTTGY